MTVVALYKRRGGEVKGEGACHPVYTLYIIHLEKNAKIHKIHVIVFI